MARLLLVDPNSGDLAERAKANALCREGWEVTVLAPVRIQEGARVQEAAPPEPGAPFELVLGRLAGKAPNRCVFVTALSQALRCRPDAVLVLADENFAMALQVLAAARLWCPGALRIAHSWQNIRCTWRRHGQPLRALYAMDTVVERVVFELAHGLMARNEEAVDVLRARGFRKPIAHVPWGVDVAQVRRVAKERNAPAIPNLARPWFGFVGRLVPEKGVDLFLRALPSLQGSAIIIGEGPLRPALEGLARQLGIARRVHFCGSIPRAEIPVWLRALDALVLPSRETAGWKEQFGRVLVEAMAVGTPCAGSRSGAIPSVIGDAGVTFDMENPPSLARALEDVVRERDLLSPMAVARADLFSWECFARGTLQFVDRVRAAQ